MSENAAVGARSRSPPRRPPVPAIAGDPRPGSGARRRQPRGRTRRRRPFGNTAVVLAHGGDSHGQYLFEISAGAAAIDDGDDPVLRDRMSGLGIGSAEATLGSGWALRRPMLVAVSNRPGHWSRRHYSAARSASRPPTNDASPAAAEAAARTSSHGLAGGRDEIHRPRVDLRRDPIFGGPSSRISPHGQVELPHLTKAVARSRAGRSPSPSLRHRYPILAIPPCCDGRPKLTLPSRCPPPAGRRKSPTAAAWQQLPDTC
jgi:hypothetical protein